MLDNEQLGSYPNHRRGCEYLHLHSLTVRRLTRFSLNPLSTRSGEGLRV